MNFIETQMDIRFDVMDVKFGAIDVKFDSQQHQINDLKTILLWGFGLMFSLILCLFGHVV